MKLSKSLKIPNFEEDNELLIHSPYWTSLITRVASYWQWFLDKCLTWRRSLPPDACLQVNFRSSVWPPYEYIFHFFCSWLTIFGGLKDFIWSDFWKHINYFFKLIRGSVQLPLGFILYIFGRWFFLEKWDHPIKKGHQLSEKFWYPERGWYGSEGECLPPVWSGLDSQTWKKTCGLSLLLVLFFAPKFFLQVLQFSSLHRNQQCKYHSTWEQWKRGATSWMSSAKFPLLVSSL